MPCWSAKRMVADVGFWTMVTFTAFGVVLLGEKAYNFYQGYLPTKIKIMKSIMTTPLDQRQATKRYVLGPTKARWTVLEKKLKDAILQPNRGIINLYAPFSSGKTTAAITTAHHLMKTGRLRGVFYISSISEDLAPAGDVLRVDIEGLDILRDSQKADAQKCLNEGSIDSEIMSVINHENVRAQPVLVIFDACEAHIEATTERIKALMEPCFTRNDIRVLVICNRHNPFRLVFGMNGLTKTTPLASHWEDLRMSRQDVLDIANAEGKGLYQGDLASCLPDGVVEGLQKASRVNYILTALSIQAKAEPGTADWTQLVEELNRESQVWETTTTLIDSIPRH